MQKTGSNCQQFSLVAGIATTAEQVLAFDAQAFPLRRLVQEAVGVEELELLHTHKPEDLLPSATFKGSSATWSEQRRLELLQHSLQELWKTSEQRQEFLQLLPSLIVATIAPQFPKESYFYFQKSPLLRFHLAWPENGDENIFLNDEQQQQKKKRSKPPGALTTIHTDGSYGHPSTEINFWLPVTLRTYGSNSLMVESEPMKGDFRPFELDYGAMVQWRGNQNRHFSHRNTTEHTRASFDFRIIPGSAAGHCDLTAGKFRVGTYYGKVHAVQQAGEGAAGSGLGGC